MMNLELNINKYQVMPYSRTVYLRILLLDKIFPILKILLATNSMCTFLAINTSSVQIILPATVVALMGAAANQIFITTLLATGLSTISAVITVKFLITKSF